MRMDSRNPAQYGESTLSWGPSNEAPLRLRFSLACCAAAGECPLDPGGYFIVKGVEKASAIFCPSVQLCHGLAVDASGS